MKVKVINKSKYDLPTYATENSAGMDLKANIENSVSIKPFSRFLCPTGLFMAIPKGYEGQIRPRSGLALKYGLCIANSPGTIDSDYRGEIKVILINLSNEIFILSPGERIAQMVFTKCEQAELELTEVLDETERGEGGFGHTGV